MIKSILFFATINFILRPLAPADNVSFRFEANYINTFKETIEITGYLRNNNLDTVYFLTSSCDGTQYSLQYDTSKFILTPFLNCNANFPAIGKIAPQGEIKFTAHFRFKMKANKIKLGFDFYNIDEKFDITRIKLIDIYSRQDNARNLKWFEASIQ